MTKSSIRLTYALRISGCLLLWWVLTGGSPSSWLIGLPAIALALWVMGKGSTEFRTVSPLGLLRFIPYFLLQSVRGGIDVAGRAFSPRLPLDPATIVFRLNLPPGTPRIFFLNSVSLLPGTLSADLEDSLLTVHVLDHQVDPRLSQLQSRVADLFGLKGGGIDE